MSTDSAPNDGATPFEFRETVEPDLGPPTNSDGDSEEHSNSDPHRSRRRRGSRGGKNRKRPQEGTASESIESVSSDFTSQSQPELPDLPWEGGSSTVESSEISPPVGPNRPRVGDSRPFAADAAEKPNLNPKSVSRSEAGDKQVRPSGKPKSHKPRSEQDSDKSRETSPNTSPDTSQADKPRGGERGIRTERSNSKSESVELSSTNATGAASDANAGRPRRDSRGKRRSDRDRPTPVVVAEIRRPRERNGKPIGRYMMAVHVRPSATQIAVLEGRSLIEHYVSQSQDEVNHIHGNIYVGRVQNVLPGMEAAFVDIATPKNAVLYRGDLQYDAGDLDTPVAGKEARIEEILRNGQLVVCQVTKNPMGAKGARLTQDVSIPGRFVVLVPNSGTYGISKRLPDDERKRLRRVLDEVKPAHHGIIVRTAAAGADADELRRDVQLLVSTWERIEAKAAKTRGPLLLHGEPNLAVRIIREEFNADYRGVAIDDREVYEEIREYVETISPELADRIEFYDPEIEPLPIFEKFHVHEQLHKAIDRKVWLPSGGSIIIERTEALTVIDVNTGKNVGSTSLEETVFRNNLEAATEIARQLRLRDIGGIIVIDFIDMEIRPNRGLVVQHFREELSKDKTRTQVFEISDLGLVEMTRKRISEGLVEALSDVCPTCRGRGFVFDPDILDE